MRLAELLKRKKDAPDFSGIGTEEAEKLLGSGDLELMYLIDPRFGGSEAMDNCLYVPKGVAALKEHFDNVVEQLLIEGKVKGYDCRPRYKGESVIPCSVSVKATGPDKKEVISTLIEIW